MQDLAHEFTERKIGPRDGIKYFHKTYLTIGIKQYNSLLDLPKLRFNRLYSIFDLVEGSLTSVILKDKRIEHKGILRIDFGRSLVSQSLKLKIKLLTEG